MILHREFLSAFDDMQLTVVSPFPSDGAVSLSYEIKVSDGFCYCHWHTRGPDITLTVEHQSFVFIEQSQFRCRAAEADLLSPRRLIVELKS